jgi:hypothetical protein
MGAVEIDSNWEIPSIIMFFEYCVVCRAEEILGFGNILACREDTCFFDFRLFLRLFWSKTGSHYVLVKGIYFHRFRSACCR